MVKVSQLFLSETVGFRQSTINMIEEEKRHITKECCVEFLVQWIHNKGTEATVGKLKEALERIKLKDVGENLISGKQERDTEVSVLKMSIMSVANGLQANFLQIKHFFLLV